MALTITIFAVALLAAVAGVLGALWFERRSAERKTEAQVKTEQNAALGAEEDRMASLSDSAALGELVKHANDLRSRGRGRK